MIKAIIFDADGMIVHEERFSERYSEKFGVPIGELLAFFEKDFLDCELGKKDLKEALAPYLPKWKWQGSVEELLEFWFSASYRDEEVVRIIENIRKSGIICILSTKQEKYRVEYFKNELGLGKLFDYIVSTHEIGVFKDNPEFYKEILKLIPEIKTSEILFFDDREKNIKAAESAGIKSILFKSIEDLKEIKND
jgi:HAD superfamily hydrolase (TIGR01509 family)